MTKRVLSPHVRAEEWEKIKARLAKGLAAGESVTSIAQSLGRNRSTVAGWLAMIKKGYTPESTVVTRDGLLTMMRQVINGTRNPTVRRDVAAAKFPELNKYGRFWRRWGDLRAEAVKLSFFAATPDDACAPATVVPPDYLPSAPAVLLELPPSVDAVAPTPPESEEDVPLAERERRKWQDQNRGLRNRIVAMERELNAVEDIQRAVFGIYEEEIIPPAFSIARDPGDGYTGVPILYFSDSQWGEVIRAGEMDGSNEYNMEIASRRYQKLIRKSVDLTTTYQKFPTYEKFVYVRAGDLINGDIHQELRETNDLAAIPAAKDLVEHEIWGVNQLLDLKDDKGNFVYPVLDIISVPGNHGRNTEKPMHKGFVGTNYETVTAYLLQAWFRDKASHATEGRVRFVTPASGDAIATIEDHVYCFTHGDRIGSRGGEGFIGPAATIMRGMHKVHAYYNRIHRPVDYVCTGHYHTSLYLGLGFANGSLSGLNEYAKSFRMIPDAPKQWLLVAHKHYGVSQMWEIIVDKKPVWTGHTNYNFTPKEFPK